MNDLIYRNEDCPKFETFEWDNVWLEHADSPKRKRVLYIGDSISCGCRHLATALTGGEVLFDGFGTSKALDNPYFKDALHLFAIQQGQRSAVLFNNGLHGFHLDDQTAYPDQYEQMVRFLLREFDGTPVFIVLTTQVADPALNARVLVRNSVASALAVKYALPVIDLYAVSASSKALSGDGIHFTDDGYRALASTLADTVRALPRP